MTAKEVYSLPYDDPTDRYGEAYTWMLNGFRYNHVPEIDWSEVDHSKNEKITIRLHKYVNFDGRRFWMLASVWFEDQPVMIIQNAGREGDDHVGRYITDAPLYNRMVSYIVTLYMHPDANSDIIDPNVDIPDLTDFYGNSLDSLP